MHLCMWQLIIIYYATNQKALINSQEITQKVYFYEFNSGIMIILLYNSMNIDVNITVLCKSNHNY